jgi:DNA ligase 1
VAWRCANKRINKRDEKTRFEAQSLLSSPRGMGNPRGRVIFSPQLLEKSRLSPASITLSPVSVAAMGMVSTDRGLSLRFPRFIKVREDKKIEDASTPDFLAELWRNQESRGQAKGGADEGDLVDRELSEEQEDEEDLDQ